MGQREDVTASLLASHGVDAVARRKVAEKVKAVAHEAAAGVANGTTDPFRVGIAASAVVLASDLRAPIEVPTIATHGYELRGGYGSPPSGETARTDCAAPLATASEMIPAGSMVQVDGYGSIRLYRGGVSPDRQGWRERLTNVERLLAEFWNNGDAADDLMGEDWAKVQQALAEVRSLLGGE